MPPVVDMFVTGEVLVPYLQVDASVVFALSVTVGPVVLPETGDVMLIVGAVASTVQVTLDCAELPSESEQLT